MKEFGTQTLGLNPEVLTEEIVMERLTTNEQLNDNRKRAAMYISMERGVVQSACVPSFTLFYNAFSPMLPL